MNATKLIAVALAALVVTTGAAAAAGSSYDAGETTHSVDATLDENTVTVTVQQGGEGLENATVYANDETYTTDANGTVTFDIDNETDEVEIEVETDSMTVTQEYAVENGSLVLQKSEFERVDETDEREDEREDENEAEDEREEAEDEREEAENESRDERAGAVADEQNESDAGAAAAQRGPPSDMPGPVPDHVSRIHQTISEFLSGTLDGSLGSAISGIAGNGNGGDAPGRSGQAGPA